MRTWRRASFAAAARGRSLTRASLTRRRRRRTGAARRDPEMHQTKKGKRAHAGSGRYAGSGLAHSLTTTAANASDRAGGSVCCMALRRRRGATQATRGWRSVPSTLDGGVEWRMATLKPVAALRLLGEGVAEEAARERARRRCGREVEHPLPVREAALRLRQRCALPGRGKEQAAHRVAVSISLFSDLLIAGRYATG